MLRWERGKGMSVRRLSSHYTLTQARTPPSCVRVRGRSMLTGNIVLSSIYRSAIECSISGLRCVEKKTNKQTAVRLNTTPSLPRQTRSKRQASRPPHVWTDNPMTICHFCLQRNCHCKWKKKIYYLYLKSFQIKTFK